MFACPVSFLLGVEFIMTLYANDFSKIFSELLEKSGVTCYQISQYSHLDEGYLSRLRNVGKHDPSPEVIIKICLALANCNHNFKLHDFESLFNSVGRTLFPYKKSNPYY